MSKSEQHFKRLCVVGAGLIGGSFARALRKAHAVDDIVAYSRNPVHLEEAVSLGVIDRYSADLSEAVKGADLIFISVPLSAFSTILPQIVEYREQNSIVTDAGSAKTSVIEAVQAANAGDMPDWFVPGHPIAGTEQSGVGASFAELFRDHRVILTPTQATSRAALAAVQSAWEATGASVTEMDADHHDEVLAATSHLPHVLAYALVDTLAKMADRREIFAYAAGGFRDFTRIASSDPVMWRDICLNNKAALLDVLDAFSAGLNGLREQISNNDGDALLETFSRSKMARQHAVQRMAVGRPNPNE